MITNLFRVQWKKQISCRRQMLRLALLYFPVGIHRAMIMMTKRRRMVERMLLAVSLFRRGARLLLNMRIQQLKRFLTAMNLQSLLPMKRTMSWNGTWRTLIFPKRKAQRRPLRLIKRA